MKLRVLAGASLIAILCGGFAVSFVGCDRGPSAKKDGEDPSNLKVEIKQASPFQAANDVFKFPNNPRANDDWTRFREGIQLLSEHFNKPEVLARMRLSGPDRTFLDKQVHLTPSEFAEVESTAFRTADSYHMDECYLLRDIAQHLEVRGITPLAQAGIDFRWVMRNVMLHENLDTWMPPAFAVRRGWGSAVERALVFLALLRQSQVEGCLIVVPDTEPMQFLVAVHDTPSKSLRLFDPRLERPVLGKDGKSVATLKEVQENPELLQPSMINAEQTKKLEAWMVCPLYALSPRMFEMQKGLRSQDFVTLYMSPRTVYEELSQATTLPIKVWNPMDASAKTPSGPGLAVNSPTRCLRLFLPKNDGGLDETDRLLFFNLTRIPIQEVLNNYAQIRLTRDLLPLPVFQYIVGLSENLLGKYDIQTRELYLRGRYEPLIRRQDRIQDFANNDSLANLMRDEAFQKERSDWQKKISEAYAGLAPNNDNAGVDRKVLQSNWAQDQYVAFLLATDKEEKLDRKYEKTVLTKILAVGMRDHLQAELARMRANTFHEIAADRQTALDVAVKPSKGFRSRVNISWFDAKSAWGSDRINVEQMISQRLKQIHDRIRADDINSRVRMLEILHLDVRRYFQARQRLAEVLVHTDGDKAAKDSLAKTKSELESVVKAGLLKNEINDLRNLVREQNLVFFQKRLDLLDRDWTEHGNYFWLQRQFDIRLADSKGSRGAD